MFYLFVGLVLVVSAVAFRPANDSRRIREAARAINVYLGSARNHPNCFADRQKTRDAALRC